MDYQQAHDYIFNEIGEEGINLLILVADDKTTEGINLIKQLTSCSDNDAKLLWVDLKCKYGTSENNSIIEAKENLSQQEISYNNQVAKEWKNKPKCPTCSSNNVKRISETSKAISVAMFGLLSQKVKKRFHCNNCGYEW